MAEALVIGYGNPLRSDDGLGWKVVEALSERLESERVELLPRHQLTPELVDTIRERQLVIFVDARAGSRPGELHFQSVEPVAENLAMMHNLSPSALLTLCQKLYETVPRAYVLSISGECFDHGEGLSTPVQKTIPRLLDRIQQLLGEYTG